MNKNSRQLQKDQTRLSLLATSRKLFLEHGYEGTTTRMIAEAAGVSIGSVFVHFPDKRQLLREILLNDIANILQATSISMPERAGVVAALLHYADPMYAYYGNQRSLSMELLKDTMFDNPAFFRPLQQAFIGELAGRTEYDNMKLNEEESVIVAQCFFSLYLVTLIEGLTSLDTGPKDWLFTLKRRCQIMLTAQFN